MVKEILIIRLSSIGDVTLCTPVARSLKLSWPDCKVTWLIGEVSAELLQHNPYVDEIIVWSREKFDKYVRSLAWEKALALWKSLRIALAGRTFYAVLDIHGLFLTGMIAKMAKTDRRIGLKPSRELNSLFMTELALPTGTHIIDRYLGVLRTLGIPQVEQKMTIVVVEQNRQFAELFLGAAGLFPHERFAVLVPGTTWPTKNWPTELFARTACLLSKDFKILLCGGNAEISRGREIQEKAGVPVINAVGKTKLLEMAGLIEQAAVVVAGDTGPLHIAAALGVPTVGIFGPTDPAIHAPLGRHNAVAFSSLQCSFCHKTHCPQGHAHCINRVQPEEVVKKAQEVARKVCENYNCRQWFDKGSF